MIISKRTIFIILLLFVIAVMYMTNKRNSNKLHIAQNNLEVINDSLKTIQLSNGKVLYERGVLISTLEDLKKINNRLANDISKIKEVKPKKFIQSKVDIKTKDITLNTSIVETSDSTYTIKFEHDTIYNEDNGRTIRGFVYINYNDGREEKLLIKDFKITEDILKIKSNLVLGERDGRIKVWLNSDFPGFTVKDIDAVILDTKNYPILKKLNNKRFNVGPYIGLQLNRETIVSPSIGIGLQYSLLKF